MSEISIASKILMLELPYKTVLWPSGNVSTMQHEQQRRLLGLIKAAASSPCDVAAGEQVFVQGLEPLGLAESGE